MEITNHLPISLLVILSIFIPLSNSVSFNISSFEKSSTSMVYEGDATIFDGAIELNTVDYMYRVGRAIYSKPIQLWDPSTNITSDFTTTFSYSIDTLNSSNFCCGFSFFLAPVDSHLPPNSAGGFQGLYNTTMLQNMSDNHMVSVEFDSYVNPEWDPSNQHVGINVNSLRSSAFRSWDFTKRSGEIGRALINYSSSSGTLQARVFYVGTPHKYELSDEMDLRKILPQWIVVGFTASTGEFAARHRIHAWEFSSTFDSTFNETADQFPNASDRETNKQHKYWLIFSLSVSNIGLLLIISFIAVRTIRFNQTRKGCKIADQISTTVCSISGVLHRGAWPRQFSYQELAEATNNFSDEMKLGQGGFGCVYKGVLADINMKVAVKKMSNSSKQGKKEYMTEVLVISSLRHKNLVRLLGWSHDKRDQLMLVYEFMPNASLDSHLFGNKTTLAWSVRYKIAQALASALLYLHEEWEQCVVHRDIKASNIMLDSNFNAKLGDFGLARLMDHEELSLQTTALAGTWGYLAPEFLSKSKASKETDVYSFGVVALEIACGRRSVDHNVEESRVRLVEWVWGLYGEGRVVEAADEKLVQVFDVEEMECLMVVGLWCAHPDHSLRPDIKQAIQVLNFEVPIPQLPTKMPVPVYWVPPQHKG